MSDTSQTPGATAAHATQPAAIDATSTIVVGVISTGEGPAALLRSARGVVSRARVGDSVFGLAITAIGDDQVLVTDRWGQTQALALPQG